VLRAGATFSRMGFTGSLLASLLAAAVATTALHPLNTVKTRIQVGLPPMEATHKLRGLYRGLLFGLASDLPTESIAMAMTVLFNTVFVTWEGSAIGDHSNAALFLFSVLSGALGTVLSSFVEAPMEMLVKQMQTKPSKGPRDAIRTVFFSHGSGIRLLNSWLVLLSREVPFGSCSFAFYEAGRRALAPLLLSAPTLTALLSGGLAGGLTMVLVAPLDVLVSRVMAEDETDELAPKVPAPCGLGHVGGLARQIWREEGIRGFWRGTPAGVLYYGLWSCLFFAVYEAVAAVVM